jgi:hypothetical protein
MKYVMSWTDALTFHHVLPFIPLHDTYVPFTSSPNFTSLHFTSLPYLTCFNLLISRRCQYPDHRARQKTCPTVTLSTINPTWPDLGSNPGSCGGKPVTDRLSYNTASLLKKGKGEHLMDIHLTFQNAVIPDCTTSFSTKQYYTYR